MQKVGMERVDVSAMVSNLLVFSAVLVASAAFVLGDQLGLIASNLFNEGESIVMQISASVQMWLS
ncbi:MAG TPA: hypothetical protein VFH31_11840 [Pyrinomonadaceae bacterium]|nr:hypothetical protein [Pyrinomonadaceae bacterium]